MTTTTEDWQRQLERDGFVVVPDVLTRERCDYYVDRIWGWLEGLGTGIKRGEPETWRPPNWPLSFKGIITYPSVSHTDFSWEMRDEPTIRDLYRKIWATDDLIVSFQRLNCTKPFNEASSKAKSKSGSMEPGLWLHSDIRPIIRARDSRDQRTQFCVQGFVNLEDCGERDAGFVVLKGSHRHYDEAFQRFGIDKVDPDENFFTTSKRMTAWLIELKGCELVNVRVPKGGFVLWDARTFHCNSRPTKFSTPGRFRYVGYVCMCSRNWLTEDEQKRKLEALLDMKSTAPWPHEIVPFQKRPSWARDVELPAYREQEELPPLTERMLRLAGLTDDEVARFDEIYADHKKKVKKVPVKGERFRPKKKFL